MRYGSGYGGCPAPYWDKSRTRMKAHYPKSVGKLDGIDQFDHAVACRSNNCGIPKQCQSCDDHCAKKDGKRGKHDYKEKSRLTITLLIVVDLDD